MPDPTLQSSLPEFTIAGTANSDFGRDLLSMRIIENTQGLYRCEFTLVNISAGDTPGFAYFDTSKIDFGKKIEIKMSGADSNLFTGLVMGIEANFEEGEPPTLTILAEDSFQSLRMTRRTRSFVDMSDAAIFQQIASEHNLSPRIDVNGPTHRSLTQVNQSDLAFMRERARVLECELWLEDTTLNVARRSSRGQSTVDLNMGQNLVSFRATADLATQRTSVTVSGWDVGAKEAIKYKATDSVISSELNGSTSGSSLLQSAFAERDEVIAHTVPLSSEETQANAESYFRMMARRFVVAHGEVSGDARLHVGVFVNVASAGPFFNGKYYLSGVEHSYDRERGFRTYFVAERPGIGRG